MVILAGKDMSINAQNVKIITNNGRVTLRRTGQKRKGERSRTATSFSRSTLRIPKRAIGPRNSSLTPERKSSARPAMRPRPRT